ncbi:MAG: 3-hydroxyacyl-ACP dehydratase FabZ family protein [Puniceicoccaceae bacterium]
MTSPDILSKIPHRPPFLFIDEIVETTPTGATARRTVRAEEPHFEGHYPGNPIMPGVLLCEAVFQTGAYFLVGRAESEGEPVSELTPVLSRIREARFKQMVKPGDELLISVEMLETVTKFHFMKGIVRKGGKTVLTLEFALALI